MIVYLKDTKLYKILLKENKYDRMTNFLFQFLGALILVRILSKVSTQICIQIMKTVANQKTASILSIQLLK